jgi:two-component system, NarL family, sensor histidine kinase DesK
LHAGGRHVEGNGLRGMRERVVALGGRLLIGDGDGVGTTLRIELPVAANGSLAARAGGIA